jgi:hypothetical protein
MRQFLKEPIYTRCIFEDRMRYKHFLYENGEVFGWQATSTRYKYQLS